MRRPSLKLSRSTKMNSETDSSDRAVLLVVGRTRIGKGEFISTANLELCGSSLPDIVSEKASSQTKKTQRYPMRLHDRDIEMVDTVGFDCSSQTDTPEETLMQFLADTKKADFYPPLVILQTLSGMEKDLFEKMNAVFPEIVVAYRTENVRKLNDFGVELAEECGRRPRGLFALKTFFPSDDDDGKSRQTYENNVSTILTTTTKH